MKGAGSFADAQANVAALDACPRHHFEISDELIAQGVGAMFGMKLNCHRCNGRMDMLHINQYVRGYAAAGGNPNDILPGWNNDETNGRTERRFFNGNAD